MAFCCQSIQLFNTKIKWPLPPFFKWISFLGVGFHGFLLYKMIETPKGQNLDALILLSMMFWLLNISLLILSNLKKIENLSLIAYPPTLAVLIMNIFWGQSDIVQTTDYHGMVSHIIISLLATSTLCLAFMQSLLLGIQHYKLRHPRESRLLALLPPLQTMEVLLFAFVWLGVICLSLALVSGIWFQHMHPELGHQPEIILSFVAWALFVGLLVGRYCFGIQAQTALIGVSTGFALIFISYFGSKFLL